MVKVFTNENYDYLAEFYGAEWETDGVQRINFTSILVDLIIDDDEYVIINQYFEPIGRSTKFKDVCDVAKSLLVMGANYNER